MKKHHQTVIAQVFAQIKLGISWGNSLCYILSAPPDVAAGEKTEVRRATLNLAMFQESPERLCEVSWLVCTQAVQELWKSGPLLLPFATGRVQSICHRGWKVARTLLALNSCSSPYQVLRAAPLLLGREIMDLAGPAPCDRDKDLCTGVFVLFLL